MTSDIESESAQAVSKGKGRAHDVTTERTPLLAAAGSSRSLPQHLTPRGQRRLGVLRFLCVFLTTLLICIILALAVLLLLAWSYFRSSEMSPEVILHKALVLEGPDRVDVLNISFSDGIWVEVEGRIGLDAGSVVGVNPDPQDGVLDLMLKGLGKWGVRNLEAVTVQTSTITISSRTDPPVFLANLTVPPLEIPLTVDPPKEHRAWLQRISTPVLVQPTSKTSHLLHFAQESWKNGQVMVTTEVSTVDVRGGGVDGAGWKRRLHRELTDVVTTFSVKVPELPGFPHPGRNAPIPPLADLVTLLSFQLSNNVETNNLSIKAVASVVDPAPATFNLTTPSLPFIISLLPLTPPNPDPNPNPIPIASVQTRPFSLTHPNISLDITGHVLPLPSNGDAFPTFSKFLTRYLSGLSNPISISTPLIHDMTVELAFPAPNPKPRILQNVTIRDMKIKPNSIGSTFLASGTVLAHVVLPKGMDIDLDVKKVLPDVLVFDGEVPDDVDVGIGFGEDIPSANTATRAPEFPPLPDPLPEGAFGHIRPDDWVDSRCVKVDSESSEGSEFAVSAKIVDVPLEVLPGRQKEFSDFVSKIIFGPGATAGILGTTAVGVHVPGIPGVPDEPPEGQEYSDGEMSHAELGLIELSGLPFRGSVKLGKGNLLQRLRRGSEEKWKDLEKDIENQKREMLDRWKKALKKLPHW
ncbi:hypothetical protein GYMLUDRAFT_224884 [Collybiopsis luxurians FD-317 M1]|uniref:Uncharacterized protein n=1 Tax=Collybiopsis luxurians FD-317 M1 TaxID=944289 RepID=A0A0D0CZ50_9AGAR|nr:hypothetical protein GYMLUDRAFT_224884 [Collybiopsis luxurians FD-317 M1]